MPIGSEVRFFIENAAGHPQWQWYAIADSAQSRQLPAALLDAGGQARCLLGASQGTPLAAESPHLVPLCAPDASNAAWQWIDLYARRGPSVTVIASLAGFDALFLHLQKFAEVRLPDGDTMFFAFWDPAILGALIGQADDPTLHVRGPIFTREQGSAMFEHVEGWWYWDREGGRRSCAAPPPLAADIVLPLQLAQTQVDDLVEASVPDHVLYYLDLNQPLLLAEVPPPQRYAVVRSAIQEARDIGLEGMKDLVNYVCAALVYKDRMRQDAQIRKLLEAVKHGSLSFTAALNEMPG
ncbi:DUF4123 domain-containing protein [Duganella sp. CT11-25]|uniref:DUF4123 domain-containing protein n=1 Tax=unclassified Duganella TaxID=2636909 RepID=UPI0039B0F88D